MDFNSDGVVNMEDRHILENIINNGAVYDEDILIKCDVNRDGNIDSTDLQLFNQYMEQNKLKITVETKNMILYD